MGKFYAVYRGRVPGVYDTWEEAKSQVNNYPKAVYKSFGSYADALEWMESQNSPTLSVNKKPSQRMIYTDGSCQKGYAGWAYVVVEGNQIIREKSGNLSETSSTNNRAELSAILNVLKDFPNQDLVICPDSEYAINCVTLWWITWEKKEWKTTQGKPVENQDLIKEILSLQKGRNVEYRHVYGHSNNPYNERCDVLAKEAIEDFL